MYAYIRVFGLSGFYF